jgi:hypothetical protein
MRHIIISLFLLAMLSPAALGRDKKLIKVKVEIVEQPEGSVESVQGGTDGSLVGAAAGAAVGRRVVTDAWTMKVIINGEHAILKCYENHHACHFVGVGTYDAELKTHTDGWTYGGPTYADPDLWIHYIRPIDHVDMREHWKVDGSW